MLEVDSITRAGQPRDSVQLTRPGEREMRGWAGLTHREEEARSGLSPGLVMSVPIAHDADSAIGTDIKSLGLYIYID